MLTLQKLQFTLREKCSITKFFWSEYRKIQKNDALQSLKHFSPLRKMPALEVYLLWSNYPEADLGLLQQYNI